MHETDETSERGGTGTRADRERTGDTASDDGRSSTGGTSRRRVMAGTGATLATVALGGLPTAAAQSGNTREVLVVGCQGTGTITLADANTYEHIEDFDSSPGKDSPPITDPIKKIAKPIVDSVAGRENVCEHINVSPDGETLYVSRANLGDTVAIDMESREIQWRTEMLGFRSDHAQLTPEGDYLYQADIMADKVWKIDTETGEKVDCFEASDWPHGTHVHEDRIINGSLGSMVLPDEIDGDHRLTFADRDTLEVTETIDFEEGVRPFAFADDDETVYVQISYMHGFHEVDVESGEIQRTKDLPVNEHVPDSEDDYPLQAAHHGIEVSPDGQYICAAGTVGNYAAVVDRESFETVGITDVGKYPYWVSNAPDGEHAFVSVKNAEKVSVIEYETAEEVATIPTGEFPMVSQVHDVPEAALGTGREVTDPDDGLFGGLFD
ncbi:hypothetical protein BV210_16990 [Halorientalis sp. IM1011]|uniref:YncE family protein n=1 Tax=Halorientalis sp. IM1011 TaxID=1932360 RepID=UPI00097CCFF1|nr:YncE family protein [Halorientalis sp. IM1011]AQL44307.1 hypothetical protein BV210_16990 [Halorientalis sp. IM1011]